MPSFKDFLGHPSSFFSPASLSEEKGAVWHSIARLVQGSRLQIQGVCMLLFVQGAVLADTFTGEYFLESDPGVGQGIVFTTDAAGSLDLTIPTDALSFGLHRIGFRVQDADGNWSTNDFRHFLKLDTLTGSAGPPVAVEYFFDTDPGVGSGTEVALAGDGSLTLDLPSDGFPFGLIRIGIRVRDAQGIWSTNDFRHFLKLDALTGSAGPPVSAEYFFDTDPGVGSGTEVALAGDGSLTLDLPSDGFPFGLTRIGIRVRDAQGIWSTNDFRHFLKLDALPDDLPNEVHTIWWTIKNSAGTVVKNGTWPANGSASFLLARVLEVGDLTEGAAYQLEVGAADSLGRSGPLSIHAFMVQPDGSDPNDTNNNGVPDDVTPATWTFNDWLTKSIGPDAPANQSTFRAGFHQDADGDGIPNALEYLFGLDPQKASPPLQLSPDVLPLLPDDEEVFLSITFTEIPAASANVKVIVECATSLNPNQWNPVQRAPEVISETGETRVIRYLDDEPISASNKRFMRLRLEEAP